jgi:hypothetical protein
LAIAAQPIRINELQKTAGRTSRKTFDRQRLQPMVPCERGFPSGTSPRKARMDNDRLAHELPPRIIIATSPVSWGEKKKEHHDLMSELLAV